MVNHFICEPTLSPLRQIIRLPTRQPNRGSSIRLIIVGHVNISLLREPVCKASIFFIVIRLDRLSYTHFTASSALSIFERKRERESSRSLLNAREPYRKLRVSKFKLDLEIRQVDTRSRD